MNEADGLVLGIDLSETAAQVCFFNTKLNTPEAVKLDNGSVIMPNPVKLSEVFLQEQGIADNITNQFISFFAMLIEYGKKAAGRVHISQICVVIDNYHIDYLNGIKYALETLQYECGDFQIISRGEAFAYYAYSQKKELYSAGVTMLDFNENGLMTYRLNSARKNGIDYIFEERKDFETESLKKAGSRELNIGDVCNELCEDIDSLMSGKSSSSIYLTGRGFEEISLPDKLTKVICNRRKAFAGHNLFVKGACYCAQEQLKPKVFDNIILACEQRVKSCIETDISDRGQSRRLRIIKPGTNWFMAERTLDFILEDERNIIFKLTDLKGNSYEESIDISDIPFRQGKTTRISVNIRFTASDRCMITVKDKGFGQFFKSSGKAFYLELSFKKVS